jgi:hypothetical protein
MPANPAGFWNRLTRHTRNQNTGDNDQNHDTSRREDSIGGNTMDKHMRVEARIAGMGLVLHHMESGGYQGTISLPFLDLSSLESSVLAPVGRSKNSV